MAWQFSGSLLWAHYLGGRSKRTAVGLKSTSLQIEAQVSWSYIEQDLVLSYISPPFCFETVRHCSPFQPVTYFVALGGLRVTVSLTSASCELGL